MKGSDLKLFLVIFISSFVVGCYIFDISNDQSSDLITFLSIMIGFKITSLSILYNSALKKTLYDRKNKIYQTELHRLKDYFKHSLFFEVFSILILFIVPIYSFTVCPDSLNLAIGRYFFILPILTGTSYCFYKVASELFKIFTQPTNEN